MSLTLTLTLASCVSEPVATPNEGLGGILVTADRTGYKLKQHRYEYEIGLGVPAKYFTPRNDKEYPWYLSGDDEPYVANFLLQKRNSK